MAGDEDKKITPVGTVQTILQLIQLHNNPGRVCYYIIFMLQMGKVQHRDVKKLIQGHTESDRVGV